MLFINWDLLMGPCIPSEESHARAWRVVVDYINDNLRIFPSKLEHAESALLPNTKLWVKTSLEEMNCLSADDHSIFIWLNCPVVGIISSEKYDYFLTCICNLLADFPKNSVAVILHPNRAASLDKRTGWVKTLNKITSFTFESFEYLW